LKKAFAPSQATSVYAPSFTISTTASKPTLLRQGSGGQAGLSSRSVLERLSEIQMLDVNIPATDGRQVRMKRYTRPEKVHHLLLDQLGFTLPCQPRQKSEIPDPWWRPFEKTNAKSTIQSPNSL
jgi:hypothetical protein